MRDNQGMKLVVGRLYIEWDKLSPCLAVIEEVTHRHVVVRGVLSGESFRGRWTKSNFRFWFDEIVEHQQEKAGIDLAKYYDTSTITAYNYL